MAATVAIDYVIDEMREAGLNCWGIYDGKNLLAEQDDPNYSLDESVSTLMNKLHPIRSSVIMVRVSGVPRKSRKGAETHKVRTYIVDLRDSVDPVANKAPTAIAGTSAVENKLREELLNLRTQLVKTEYQQKIDALEKRINDMEEGEDDGINGFAKQLMPLLVNAFNNNASAPATTLAGLPGDGEQLLNEWIAVDPGALDVLRKIVDLARREPGKYSSYKPMIMSL